MPPAIPPAIQMERIYKRFSNVVANDGVNFVVNPGEIHALLGENGAGKSTLMNVLYGLIQPDQGEIKIHGMPVHYKSPREAISQGIAMVHQHFMLVNRFSVVENVVLGMGTPGGVRYQPKNPIDRIRELSKTFGLKVNPNDVIDQLSVGEQQRVEIIKALYRDADILILDEPTSVLTPQETDQLFKVLRVFVSQGHTVIFISHKLNEVLSISDRITVMRDGKVVNTINTSSATKENLAEMMVGRKISLDFIGDRTPPGLPVIELDDIWTGEEQDAKTLKGVSLSVKRGEILGIAGVDGNGQRDLAELIVGLQKSISGKIIFNGTALEKQTPRNAIKQKISHIPENRHERAMLPNLPIWRTLLLGSQDKSPFAISGILNMNSIYSYSKKLLEEFDVRPADSNWPVDSLSGGNQQKVILAREIDRSPQFVIASQPTRGLDIQTTYYVRERLLKERDSGVGILLISTDLQEIMSLSDRVIVLFEGKVMGCLERSDLDITKIGLMMAGELTEKKVGLDVNGYQ